MDESRRGTLAEATDVIGSQSRQEATGIKHNRYAFRELAPVRGDPPRTCKRGVPIPIAFQLPFPVLSLQAVSPR